MPCYPIRCLNPTCKALADQFAKLVTRGRVQRMPKLRCPECGGLAEQDFSRKTTNGVAEKALTGRASRSMRMRFHPREVPEARRLFGDKGGDCIKSDGHVDFKNTTEVTKFYQKAADIRFKAREKRGVDPAGLEPGEKI